GCEEVLVAGGERGEWRAGRQLVDHLRDGAVAAGGDDGAAAGHRRAVAQHRRALARAPHDARVLAERGELARQRLDAAAIVGGPAVRIRGDDDHRRREYSGYASGRSTTASGAVPSTQSTSRTPSRRRSCPAP